MFTSVSLAPFGVCVLASVALSLCAPCFLLDLKIIIEVVVCLFLRALLRFYRERQEFLSGLFRSLDPSGQPIWNSPRGRTPHDWWYRIGSSSYVLIASLVIRPPWTNWCEFLSARSACRTVWS